LERKMLFYSWLTCLRNFLLIIESTAPHAQGGTCPLGSDLLCPAASTARHRAGTF
jgi:hypothetical protein